MKREELARIVAEHEARGVTLTETAAILGCNVRTVSRVRARNRGYLKKVQDPLTEEALALYERLLDDGWSYKEIRRTYGVNDVTLAKYFPGRGWTPEQVGEYARSVRTLNTLKGIPAAVQGAARAKLKTPHRNSGAPRLAQRQRQVG